MENKEVHMFDLDFYNKEVTQDAKDWVESQFPVEHYGKDIEIYEAWGMRYLFEIAYMAGKLSQKEEI